MIRLPAKLIPSELLHLDGLPPFVADLLERSRTNQRQGQLSEGEKEARDAFEASQGVGGQVGKALSLIHLSDVHLATGNLGAAMREARQAYRLFASQPLRHQRHNEAVAAYALALAHHALGDRADALRWYQRSDDLLEQAKDHWSTLRATSNYSRCKRAQRWIRALSKALTRAQLPAQADWGTSIWLPVILPESDDEREVELAQLEVERYVVAGTLTLGDRTYRIERLEGQPPISLPVEAEYYALPIPDDALSLLGATEGDFALIVQRKDAPQEGPGVVETLSGVEFGHFVRDQAGNISFTNKKGVKIIGGDPIDEDCRAGNVTALLKRTPE